MIFSFYLSYQDNVVTIPHDIITTIDFNFHAENKSDFAANRFCSILDSRGVKQHVTGPTHK